MVELGRKDKITKDREKYTHVITMLYPIQNVMNMKKEWRINLDEMMEGKK